MVIRVQFKIHGPVLLCWVVLIYGGCIKRQVESTAMVHSKPLKCSGHIGADNFSMTLEQSRPAQEILDVLLSEAVPGNTPEHKMAEDMGLYFYDPQHSKGDYIYAILFYRGRGQVELAGYENIRMSPQMEERLNALMDFIGKHYLVKPRGLNNWPGNRVASGRQRFMVSHYSRHVTQTQEKGRRDILVYREK